jgi:hypothetical protein
MHSHITFTKTVKLYRSFPSRCVEQRGPPACVSQDTLYRKDTLSRKEFLVCLFCGKSECAHVSWLPISNSLLMVVAYVKIVCLLLAIFFFLASNLRENAIQIYCWKETDIVWSVHQKTVVCRLQNKNPMCPCFPCRRSMLRPPVADRVEDIVVYRNIRVDTDVSSKQSQTTDKCG